MGSFEIPINDQYRVELDRNSWAVSKCKPRKDGKKVWQQCAWCKTLQQAAEYVRERLLFETEANDANEIINAVSASTELIAMAIREAEIPNSWKSAQALNGCVE